MSGQAMLKIKDLQASGLFSDLTITCAGEEFKVHKSILWLESEYFRKLLGGKFKEANASVLELHDDHPAVLASLMHYFYHFTLDTSSCPANIGETPFTVYVYAIADKYDVPPLRALAEKRLSKLVGAYFTRSDFMENGIDNFIATVRAVEECTADKTLWNVLLPPMQANMSSLLKCQPFKELLLDLPELNFELLSKLGSAASSSSATSKPIELDDDDETDPPRPHSYYLIPPRGSGRRLG